MSLGPKRKPLRPLVSVCNGMGGGSMREERERRMKVYRERIRQSRFREFVLRGGARLTIDLGELYRSASGAI